MAHNQSPRKRSSEALRTPLANLDGYTLAIDCLTPECARGRAYLARDLAGVYRGLTVGEAIQRMRCGVCGKRPAEAALRPGPALRGTRATTVFVVGAGSY